MTLWPRVDDEQGATAVPATHTHPLPLWARVVLLAYAVLLALALAGGAVLYLGQRARDAATVEATRLQVLAELDRRTAARDAEVAAQQAETFGLVCEVLAGDLQPSERTQRLARRLGCPEVPPPD